MESDRQATHHIMKPGLRLFLAALSAFATTAPLVATNGMNMEGYGPVATSLGGASFAFDNGTAAIINNPATLGLMADRSRLDVAVGLLSPSITATNQAGQRAKSKATA